MSDGGARRQRPAKTTRSSASRRPARFREPRTRILKHGDTFAVLNQFGDMVGEPRQPRRALSPGHALPVAARAAAQRRPAAAAQLEPGRGQRGADRRSRQSRHDRARRQRAASRADLRQPAPVRLAGRLLRAAAGPQFRRRAACRDARPAVSPPISPMSSRCAASTGRGAASARPSAFRPMRSLLRYRGLDGIERDTHLAVRAGAGAARHGSAAVRAEAQRRRGRRASRCASIAAPPASEDWGVRRYYRALCARRGTRCGRRAARGCQRRQLQRRLQRAGAPLGRRSLHADDRDADTGLPVCRHPLVQHGVRPRRHHHRAVDAVARPDDRQGRAALSRGDASDRNRSASATPSRARSCTRCARARWRGSARCRSRRYYGSVDATPLFVMLRRRLLRRAPAISTRSASSGRTSRPRCDWIDTYGDRDRRRLCRIRPPKRDRAGQSGLEGFATTRSSMPTASSPRGRSRCARCRAMSMPPSGMPPRWRARSATTRWRRTLDEQAETLRRQFEEAFWCEELSTYALALDGDKRPCRVVASNAGHALLTGIAAPERAARVADTLLGSAAFSGWGIRTVARRRRATTRSRITTARSGRTTTR